jgi:hypothetical protein
MSRYLSQVLQCGTDVRVRNVPVNDLSVISLRCMKMSLLALKKLFSHLRLFLSLLISFNLLKKTVLLRTGLPIMGVVGTAVVTRRVFYMPEGFYYSSCTYVCVCVCVCVGHCNRKLSMPQSPLNLVKKESAMSLIRTKIKCVTRQMRKHNECFL